MPPFKNEEKSTFYMIAELVKFGQCQEESSKRQRAFRKKEVVSLDFHLKDFCKLGRKRMIN